MKIKHQKKCLKKLQKESEAKIDIDVIPNCPVTFETDISNFEANFDTICANFLGEWCEVDIRKNIPQEKKSNKIEGAKSVLKSETKSSKPLDKVEKVNNFFMGIFV